MMLKVYYKYSTVLNHKNDVTLERYKLMRSRYDTLLRAYSFASGSMHIVFLTSSIQAQLLNLKLHNASGHCNSDSAMLA